MKHALILLLMILLACLPVFSDSTIEKEFKVKEGQLLDVNVRSGGSITVTGWNKSTVKVTVYFRNGDAEDWDIEIRQTDEGVEVESGYFEHGNSRHHSPKFEFSVPEKFDLKLKTMGGGLKIVNVNGELRGKTMGGELDLSRLKGQLSLTTMGGKITLKDSDVDGSVKTMGGRVLLENVVGNVKGSSMGGNVVYRNVKSRQGKSTGETVKISTMGGSINVDEALEGADVHTMGGKIRVKSARVFVKAKTMGGDIDINAIDGWVKATTMGGDIEVSMVGNPDKGDRKVTLTSMGGDITLTVPAGLSMDVEMEIGITKRSFGDHEIESDFPIKVSREKDPEYRKGKYRELILGKGVVKGGKHKILLKTVNGSIYLKKSK